MGFWEEAGNVSGIGRSLLYGKAMISASPVISSISPVQDVDISDKRRPGEMINAFGQSCPSYVGCNHGVTTASTLDNGQFTSRHRLSCLFCCLFFSGAGPRGTLHYPPLAGRGPEGGK